MNEAIIRLFKALPVTKKGKKVNKSLLKETISKGFIFSPEVTFNYTESELSNLIQVIEKEVGLSADKMNNAFHKSWKKIKNSSIEQLLTEQIVHYITTYGFEAIGAYDKSLVYIPLEKLSIPKLDFDKIPLTMIKGYTELELKAKLILILESGIALKEDTIKDIVDVALFVKISEDEIANIKNKEVRVKLYDYLDILPNEPVEFLRFAIYRSINKTLLIKDRVTIAEIKTKDNLGVLRLFEKYSKEYGLEDLAAIFYRFKPLFLAFRTNAQLKTIINKIRKLAVQYHEPMQEDYLNNITAMIKKGQTISKEELNKELNKVNIFRKIRLANALNFRIGEPESIMYKIRNGKSFATKFEFDKRNTAEYIYNIVLYSIIEHIKIKVKGKKIYIPPSIQYALPATEKQFTGNLPSGSYVIMPKDIVFGVHWENLDGVKPNSLSKYYGDDDNRVDLDLSLINVDGKYGWDRSYRDEHGKILFSGDITDAPKPKGASELFYIKKQENMSAILMVNHFTYDYFDKGIEVPFKIIVAQEQVKDFNQNYMVNQNNVVAIAKSVIKEKQKILGLLVTTKDECRFYFAESHIGNVRSSYSEADYIKHARQFLFDYYSNMINLNEILEMAGAKFVINKEKCDIDLSYESLEKDTILSLIK